jgi:DNA modification methylase
MNQALSDGVKMSYLLIQSDARRIPIADGVVQTCVTSPPYYGLRDYRVAGQIGLEKTLDEFIGNLVAVFREVRRVLREDGTLWMNMGDSYNAYNGGAGPSSSLSKRAQTTERPALSSGYGLKLKAFKPKDLLGVPWRLAIALQQPYAVPTCVKSEIDRAWLAAMFDGEGCIGIRRFDSYRKEKQQVYQDGFVVYTVVTNNDRELLDRCVGLTGLGSVRLKQKAASTDGRGIVSRRDSFGWRLDGNGAVDIIRAIYPYLVAKRKQACIAFTLDVLNKNGHGSRSVPPEIQEKKVYLKELISRCNQREPIDLPEWVKEPKQEVEPGWYLRSDIIWHKPNPMPESVTDRPTKSHEYLFLLSKSERYYFDAEAVREEPAKWYGAKPEEYEGKDFNWTQEKGGIRTTEKWSNPAGRNIRSVWSIPTESYPGSHFATFPRKLVEPCVKAGSSEKGCCPICRAPWTREIESERVRTRPGANTKTDGLSSEVFGNRDPGRHVRVARTTGWRPTCSHDAAPVPCLVMDCFTGSGTTGVVANAMGREFVGTELNPEYIELATRRISRPHAEVERPKNEEESHPLFDKYSA